jgi:lipoate-protein ligase A
MQARLLHLHQTPILQQLQIEEALLRSSSENWIVVNSGSPPAVVVGIGGKIEELIDLEKIATAPIPVIRRFSGGGTVVIDPNTLFVTLICEAKQIEVSPYPLHIMKWTEQLYRQLFGADFHLRENDYCYGERKFGGNAQSITKDRWLHHSSLLWDFTPALMDYLKMPNRQPDYRKKRAHTDFLVPLSKRFSSLEVLQHDLVSSLAQQFNLQPTSLKEVQPLLKSPHRKSTQQLIPIQPLIVTQ